MCSSDLRPGMSAAQIASVLTQSSLSTDPTAIPVVEFAETPDFATPATSTTVVDTTTTELPTTTTDLVTTTTVAASPTTTLPGASTTTVVAPTTTAPRTTIPRRHDDEGDDGDHKGRKPAPQPKEFSLKFGEDRNRNVLTATWVDGGTPDSYRIDCTRLAGGVNAPVETSISIDKSAVTTVERYKRRTTLLVTPASGSRCWIVSILGAVTSQPSNPAIIPPARKKDDRPVTTTTTSTTVPATSTTVAVTTTTTAPVAPVTPTTVATQKPAQAPATTAAPKSTTTVPRATTTTVTPKKTTPKKKDD